MLGDLSNWLVAISGTGTGRLIAPMLALGAAVLHAGFGALQKGRHDPWVSRAAIDFSYFLMTLPICLLVLPWPERALWPVLGGAFAIHVVYKLLQAMAYTRGAYTVVYPVVRGTGPLATVAAAGAVFGEHFSVLQWAGVASLSGGILGLAGYNLRTISVDRATLVSALALAGATGISVAVYTTYDAWGIRFSTDPLVFLFWFFVVDGLAMPALVAWWVLRGRIALPPFAPLALRGLSGGAMGIMSFGAVMVATRLDRVGEAAVLRETSVLFAAVIGWLFLREQVGPRRLGLMALIALGAVLVETGG